MNRLKIFSLVVIVLALSGLDVTSAQAKRARTLHDAAVAGDVDEVNSLLSKGADINQKNRMGGTPLHTAMMNRQKAIVELLIAKGADVNARNSSGDTPLALAVKAGQKDIVEQLIAKGADVNVMAGPGENALSLAKKGGHTEIVDLLVKNGAKEPSLEDIDGEMYGDYARPYPGTSATVSPRGRAGAAVPAPVATDLLADPNEIKTRVKTFPGLEKGVKEAADKSSTEMRHWGQIRYDNRTILLRSVQKQIEEEMALVRKITVEEKAKKTAAAIDELLSAKKERTGVVYKELAQQRREQKQAQLQATRSTRGRTRGRTTGGRSASGYGPQAESYGRDTGDMLYGREEPMRPGGQPATEEPVDRARQEEIRLWSQADPTRKDELAKSVHQQIMAEIGSVRVVAEEEKAKKTTAALDGLLLARQERLDTLLKKMEEEQLRQQAREALLQEKTAGRYSPTAPTQQNQRRTRGRRR
ncbi:MAG: ankyrin repeat domain-containing protein [Phycisphaerales bacterium]|nr:MAG: ankyrin repeat domain-containing protein [Phycisphaerales bacterium]